MSVHVQGGAAIQPPPQMFVVQKTSTLKAQKLQTPRCQKLRTDYASRVQIVTPVLRMNSRRPAACRKRLGTTKRAQRTSPCLKVPCMPPRV